MRRRWTTEEIEAARDCLASGWSTADVAEELDLDEEEAAELVRVVRSGSHTPEAAHAWQTQRSLASVLGCSMRTLKLLADDGCSGVETYEPASDVLRVIKTKRAWRITPGAPFQMRRGWSWKRLPTHLPPQAFEWQDVRSLAELLGAAVSLFSQWRTEKIAQAPAWLEWRRIPEDIPKRHGQEWQYRCKREEHPGHE